MPGTPVGTIYAEIDLDTDKYTKSQQKLLQGVTAVSLDIEKNFQNLGTHCASSFDLMRQKIQNSYDAILNSSKSTANDIMRAEEAKNAKLAAINQQQFGAQTSFIDQMKANWVAASAAIVAAWMLVNKAVVYMDMGAHAQQVASSYKIMMEAADADADERLSAMKRLTKGTISETDLQQKAVKLLTLTYNPDQIERFSNVVITASQIAGTSAAEAYDNLADAIATRMPRALVRMGAVTREQMQIVTAAVKAGADETALYELAMANLELKQLMLQGTQDQATISMQRFHAEVKETSEAIGTGLIIAADAAYRSFEFLAGGVLGLVSAYARYRALVYTAIGDDAKATSNMEIANAAWEARNALIDKASKGLLEESTVGKTATQAAKDDAQAKVDAQVAALKAIADRAKGEKDILKSLLDVNKKTYEEEVNDADHAQKMKTLFGANELNYVLGTIDAKEEALAKWVVADEAAINATVKNAFVRKAKLEALDADYMEKFSKLEDQREEKSVQVDNFMMTARSSYVTWEQKQVEAEIAMNKYLRGEIISVSAESWDKIAQYEKLTGEKMDLDQKESINEIVDLYKRDLVGGVKYAFDDLENDWSNTGKQMGDFTKRTFDSMADALATFCVTGQADWTALVQSILKDLVKIQIQAAMSQATSGLNLFGGLFGASYSGGENLMGLSSAELMMAEAKGDVFDRGNVIPFARGGVVRKPTLFPMAGGAGLMGEAGPEGVLPLARTSKGDLGVKTSGGGGGDSYNITILAVDSKSFADICDRNPAALIAPLSKAMKYGQLKDWSQMLGTKR